MVRTGCQLVHNVRINRVWKLRYIQGPDITAINLDCLPVKSSILILIVLDNSWTDKVSPICLVLQSVPKRKLIVPLLPQAVKGMP